MPTIEPRDVLGPRSKRVTFYETVLNRDPNDQAARGMYADELRLLGLDPDYEFCLRWILGRDLQFKEGARTNRRFNYWSVTGGPNLMTPYRSFSVPEPVWTKLNDLAPNHGSDWEDLAIDPDVLVYKNGSWVATRSARLLTEYLSRAMAGLRAAGVAF